jgi:O-antigen/teichoic acid export membrane protein
VPRSLILQIQFIINPIVTRVGFPLIAQVQDDIPRVRSIYLKTLNMTGSMCAPLYVGIAFFAPEIVQILLGSNWEESASLFRILAIWGLIRSTGNPIGSLLFGTGRADLALKWNLGLFLLIPPVLLVGSHYGVNGLAWALLGILIVTFIPTWYLLVRPICHAGLFEYCVAALKPFFIAIVCIAPSFLLTRDIHATAIRLVIALLLSVPLYVAISYRINRYWYEGMMKLIGLKRSQ